MDAAATYASHGARVLVYLDENPENPREWDTLGVIAEAKGSRYGDLDEDSIDLRGVEGPLVPYLRREHGAEVVVPLYRMEHSGTRVSCVAQRFRDCDPQGWDWGLAGAIFARRQDILRMYGVRRITKKVRARVEEALRAEVEALDQYFSGDVYGYERQDTGDSCWGFFGHDFKENGLLDTAFGPDAADAQEVT